MNTTQYIGQILQVVIDRPLGSRHPRHGFIYPLNYGFLPRVISEDSEELDAYVLGVFEPLQAFEGECIAVIHRLEDDDDKLVLVTPGRLFTDQQIRVLTEFQERWFNSVILRS